LLKERSKTISEEEAVLQNKVLYLFLIALIFLVPFHFGAAVLNASSGNEVNVVVEESNDIRTVVRFEISSFDKMPVNINGETYFKITCGNEGIMLNAGEPALPRICRAIIIPDDAKMAVNLLSAEYTDYRQMPVLPSKGNLSRQINPADIPYTFGDVYHRHEWYPDKVAEIRKPFIQRDYRGTVIEINAFQYHPDQNTLRVYTSVTVEVVSVGPGEINVLDRSRSQSIPSDFDLIYGQRFINYNDYYKRYTPLKELGDMLVIVYDDFAQEMQPFLEWKMQKGIQTTMVNVSELYTYQSPARGDSDYGIRDNIPDTVWGSCCYGNPYDPFEYLCLRIWEDSCNTLEGTWTEGGMCSYFGLCDPVNTSENIMAFIQDFYDDPENNLTFLLLVGDAEFVSTPPYPEYGSYASTDPSYALLAGSDIYPEIIVGRFSAQDTADVRTQVERTIAYETDPQGTDWFRKGTGIATDQLGDTAYMSRLRTKLLNFTYDTIDQIYDPGATDDEVSEALNAGRSIVNYSGHGTNGGWSTTGFNGGDVGNLINTGMLPFIISVACYNGEFVGGCFGEAWLRAQDDDKNPIGAIATYMSSIPQPWYPPQDAQEKAVDLLKLKSKTTFGGLCFNGACYMLDVNGSEGDRTFKGWHIFGDPSVQVRSDNPHTIAIASHAGEIFYTDQTYQVEVQDITGEPGPFYEGLCALYGDGIVYGTGYTDFAGNATIDLEHPILTNGPLTLTVTGFNATMAQAQVVVHHDLIITTTPLENTKTCVENQVQPEYTVFCEAFSDAPLQSGYPLLQYNINSGGTWTDVPMTGTGTESEYTAAIPLQDAGTWVSYRIYALNANEYEYTTDEYSFFVIDYGVILAGTETRKTEQTGKQVYFDFAITNDGVLDDSYQLTVQSDWQASILDEAGNPISVTDILSMNESYNFGIEVTVDSDIENDSIQIIVTATSDGTDTINATTSVWVVSEGTPLAIPFSDAFGTSDFDLSLWESSRDAQIADDAPHGFDTEHNCVHFNGGLHLRGDHFGTEGLVSKCIDLSTGIYPKLVFWYERTGNGDSPEYGDDLIVEGTDTLGQWIEITRITGLGDDMTVFEYASANLSTKFRHSRFRVRFSTDLEKDYCDTTISYDDWYIDNIYVGARPPTPPYLAAPPDGTNSTNAYPTFHWHPSTTSATTQYQIVIDNHYDFTSPHASAILPVPDTSWMVSPGLPDYGFYWKVRAYSDGTTWGEWSDAWRYIKYSYHPPSSCPILFSHDGHEFIMENPLLTACEESGYADVVTDYYHITNPLAVADGIVKFQLCELEDEITYLEDLKLITVDHPSSTRMAVSVDGKIGIYDDVIAPLTAVDQDDNNILSQVQDEDGILFSSASSGYLIVTFPNAADEDITFGISCGPKPLCPNIPKDNHGDQIAENVPPKPLKVEFLDANGNWVESASIPSRENIVQEFVTRGKHISSQQDKITIRLSWEGSYSVDVINRLVPSEQIPLVNRLEMNSFILTSDNGLRKSWNGFNGSDPLVLTKGETLEFSFASGDHDLPEMTRDYIIRAIGRYHPDFGKLSMIPENFQLYDNYPNPFNPTTTLSYDLPRATHVKLEILNILGQKVSGLVDQVQDAGRYRIEWNGTDDNGNGVASGIYFYKLTTDTFVSSKKMLLVK
jgi:hypothetical protein